MNDDLAVFALEEAKKFHGVMFLSCKHFSFLGVIYQTDDPTLFFARGRTAIIKDDKLEGTQDEKLMLELQGHDTLEKMRDLMIETGLMCKKEIARTKTTLDVYEFDEFDGISQEELFRELNRHSWFNLIPVDR